MALGRRGRDAGSSSNATETSDREQLGCLDSKVFRGVHRQSGTAKRCTSSAKLDWQGGWPAQTPMVPTLPFVVPPNRRTAA